MANQGAFIVIEGSDGSGKETQFRLLKERLSAVGYDVEVFDFPQYDKDSSHFVKQYLNGQYGPAKNISPYTASLFYALDRYEAAPKMRKALAEGKIVLCNRYVGSNMAHQGGKFSDPVEQRSFFVWEDSLEYQLLGIPRPQLNIFLKVPADIAQSLIAKKRARNYTDKSHDEHEADLEHLKKSISTYELLCQLFPNDFKMVDCTAGGNLLSIPEVNNKIWEIVRPMLPGKPSKPAHSVTVKLSETSKNKVDQKPATVTQDREAKGELSLLAIQEAQLSGLELKVPKLNWKSNGFKYYSPEGLSKQMTAKYEEFMAEFIRIYKALSSKLNDGDEAKAALMAVQPLAALYQASATAKSSGEIGRLSGKGLAELDKLASELGQDNKAGGKTSQNGRNKEPEPLHNIIARLAGEHLPQNLPSQTEPVELLDVRPRNEFKVLIDAMYPYSLLSRTEVEEQIDHLSYQQKADTLTAILRAPGGDIASQIEYQIDVTADRLLLDEVISSQIATSIKVQPATPRFGYEVPEVVDKVGVTDEYLEYFDKSLELFSSLQADGHEELAPYATLLGHKCRFQMTCTPVSLMNAPEGSGHLKWLLERIREEVAEHHPIIASELSKPAKHVEKKDEKPAAKPEPKPETKKSSSRSKSRRHRGGKSKKS